MASVASPLVLTSRVRSSHLFPATAFSHGHPHGRGVLLRMGRIPGGAFSVQQEMLYRAYYVEHQRLITSERGKSDNRPGVGDGAAVRASKTLREPSGSSRGLATLHTPGPRTLHRMEATFSL